MNGQLLRRIEQLVLEKVGPRGRNYCTCYLGECHFCGAWDRSYRQAVLERERDACAQVVANLRSEIERDAKEAGSCSPERIETFRLLDEAAARIRARRTGS